MATHNSRVILLCNISMKLVLLLLAASLWAVCGSPKQQDNYDHRNNNNNNINKQQMEMEREVLEDSGRSPDPTDHYFCGRGFADASSSCDHPCPSGSLEDCPSGMLCYFDTPCDRRDLPQPPSISPINPNAWIAPTKAPWAEDDPRLSMFCGSNWEDASNTCYTWCPDGDDSICPYGHVCFLDTLCKQELAPADGMWYPPTQAPWAENDPRLSFFCGTSWSQASQSCSQWCPDADDDNACPYGQSCFSDTSCKYTPEPSLSPTTRPPTKNPTPRPTGPTISPTLAPQPLLPDDPSNQMFCGTDWAQAAGQCSLQSHCGDTGECDGGHLFCWHRVDCDIRDYIPFEEGGRLGKPTHKEIAEKMGLTYPSDDPTDHYFCGPTLAKASEYCNLPCPNSSPLECNVGDYCFENTPCDLRVTPGYGITNPPTLRPTPKALPYKAKENYSFCGNDWAHANTCKMKWCGDNSPCSNGQSCFGDTECNIQDRGPLPPTSTPSWSPVIYEHKANHFFCGASYLEAEENCSVETYCRSGLHAECGDGQYCWPGVNSCHIADLTPPTTPSPTIDTPQPTKSPSDYDDPKNLRFCGTSWSDASDSCKGDRTPKWCPRGSNEECGDDPSIICWADTMCNIMTAVFPPSPQPTDSPTLPHPTETPIQYNDPMNISFCGHSYLNAVENCSIETHCPSGLSTDCAGQYCWTVTAPGCNIIALIGPTPMPTDEPNPLPSPPPTPSPTANPTPQPEPTASPLEKSDLRNSFYCGTSWSDANSRCYQQCPSMSGCPSGDTCFSGTECTEPKPIQQPASTNAMLNTSPPTNTPDPTRRPSTRPSEPQLEESDERNSFYCGFGFADANYRCARPCPFMTGCSDGESCFVASECNKPKVEEPIQSPYPTKRPITNYVPMTKPSPTTPSPTMPSAQLVYLPYSKVAVSKPSSASALWIQQIVKSVQNKLEDELFVIVLRSGMVIKSTLYTFEGFLESLKRYTTDGINGRYFYLGQGILRSTDDQFEYGVANLALFLAKMMDTTIQYERCEPSLISCGIPALETTFKDTTVRVECSPSSPESGMECPNLRSGCSCTLGLLNHYVGAQSTANDEKYSGADFCEISLLKSICSRRVDYSEELRWLTAMTHWVYFIQPFDDGSGWNYLDELREFVKGGMIDESFVSLVAEISVLDTESTLSSDAFVQGFFKAMRMLSEGMLSQPVPQPMIEVSTDSPTVSPQTSDPTSRPSNGIETASPSVSATLMRTSISTSEPTTEKPTERLTEMPATKKPTTDMPVALPPILSILNKDEDTTPGDVGVSSPPAVSVEGNQSPVINQQSDQQADENSNPPESSLGGNFPTEVNGKNNQQQQPGLPSDEISPASADGAMADGDSQWPFFSPNEISPEGEQGGSADNSAESEDSESPYSYLSYSMSPVTSQQDWEEDGPWWRYNSGRLQANNPAYKIIAITIAYFFIMRYISS